MWSDPPATAVGTFCFFACTDAGIERLNTLLDDPANDSRPFRELLGQAKKFEGEYFRARFTDAVLKTYPIDPADDPGFLRCEPWAFARQIFAPHQLEMRQRGSDRIELHYGEWDARRTIYIDGRKRPANQPPTSMGYSIGRWEGGALVIETAAIAGNLAFTPSFTIDAGLFKHSGQLRVTERYTRSNDGKTLQLTVTMEDSQTFREPAVLKKIWNWAPDQKIAPYKDCQRPTEFSRGVKPQ